MYLRLLPLILCFTVMAQSLQDVNNYAIFSYGEASYDDNPARIAELLRDHFQVTDSVDSVIFDWSDQVFRLSEGYRLSNWINIEGAFSFLGDTDVVATDIQTAEDGTQTVTTYNLALQHFNLDMFAVGKVPLPGRFTGLIKAGGAIWWAESELTGSGLGNERDLNTDLAYGLSVRYDINDEFLASLDWHASELDGFDVNTTTIGLGYRF